MSRAKALVQYILWYPTWYDGQGMTSRLDRAANQSPRMKRDFMLRPPGEKEYSSYFFIDNRIISVYVKFYTKSLPTQFYDFLVNAAIFETHLYTQIV